MSKLLPVLLLALSLPVSTVWADEKHDATRKAERLSEKLGLDAAQQAKVKDILESEKTKRQALREETKTRLASVLSKEQMAKLEDKGGKDGKGDRKHGEGKGDKDKSERAKGKGPMSPEARKLNVIR